MNTWGIPDWRDAKAYGNPSAWTLARWLWEFTRRRSDYREEAQRLHELWLERETACSDAMSDPTPEAKRGCEALKRQYRQAWNDYWTRWGYSKALNPGVSDHPKGDLLRWPKGNVSWIEGSPPERRQLRATLTPGPGELALTINLDRPLGQQLQTVERVAKEAQIKKHGKLVQQRRHPKKWLTYLRTLDAREAKASWREIAELLPHTAQTEQSARDTWEAANSLRFNF